MIDELYKDDFCERLERRLEIAERVRDRKVNKESLKTIAQEYKVPPSTAANYSYRFSNRSDPEIKMLINMAKHGIYRDILCRLTKIEEMLNNDK